MDYFDFNPVVVHSDSRPVPVAVQELYRNKHQRIPGKRNNKTVQMPKSHVLNTDLLRLYGDVDKEMMFKPGDTAALAFTESDFNKNPRNHGMFQIAPVTNKTVEGRNANALLQQGIDNEYQNSYNMLRNSISNEQLVNALQRLYYSKDLGKLKGYNSMLRNPSRDTFFDKYNKNVGYTEQHNERQRDFEKYYRPTGAAE